MIIKAIVKLKDKDGVQEHGCAIDDSDPEMMNWIAVQYAEVNDAFVTITDLDGKVLAFTGEVPF